MLILLVGKQDSYAQLITVLLIFVLVLAVTAWTTKWIANYQKQQNEGANIEVIETTRIANNKYIQIVRIADKYMVIAVCKDTVTMLGEISKEQLKDVVGSKGFSFKEMLDKALKKEDSGAVETEGSQSDDEV